MNKTFEQTVHDFIFVLKFDEVYQVMKWLKCLIFLAFCMIGFECKPHGESEAAFDLEDEDSFRLPGHTRPLNYDVELNVNVHNGSTGYTGRVTIKIAVDFETNVITLHNKGLNVIVAKVFNNANEELQNTVELDATKDFLKINLDSGLVVGDEYTLDISFSGNIALSTVGFYRISYTDVTSPSNEIRWKTQIEVFYRSFIIIFRYLYHT